MRELVAAFKVSLDMKYQGPGAYADWVPAWSEDYEIGDSIDCCVLGGAMYRGYEGYWSALQAEPNAPSPMTGKIPTAGERAWSRRIPVLPHYVISRSMTESVWPNTSFLRSLDAIAAMKTQSGKSILLMGGGTMLKALLEKGLVDELRLIVYPLTAGGPHDLFAADAQRQSMTLLDTKLLEGGSLLLKYRLNQELAPNKS